MKTGTTARQDDFETLSVVFPTRRHLLSSSRVDGSNLSLFVPSDRFPATGTPVRLLLSFADSDLRFELIGTVNFHRPVSRGPTQPTGIAVSFEGNDKRSASRMLALCAGKSSELGSASSPRYGKSIDCTLRVGTKKMHAQVRDLSTGGAFVVAPSVIRIRVGAEVEIELSGGFLGIGAKKLAARVVWCGEKYGATGFGARFLGGAEIVRPSLRGLLP